jgi:phospholipase A2
MESLEEQDLLNRDGIAIVYNPLVPNENVAPGFDPMSVSTWVVRLDKEEAEKLGKVAEANFLDGRDKIVKLLRAIWLRKRIKRLEAEAAEEKRRREDGLSLHPLAYHP